MEELAKVFFIEENKPINYAVILLIPILTTINVISYLWRKLTWRN